MSEILRREVVYLITAIIAIIMIIEYFFNIPAVANAGGQLRTWGVVISTMALALGAVNLMRIHGRNIRRKTPDRWPYSLVLVSVFTVLVLIGLTNVNTPQSNPVYKWLFDAVYVSLGQTLYAITGFYIFSAAYRAFRARNIDAALLLIAGCLVILTNASIGEAMLAQIPIVGKWFNDIGQVPAMRTFLMTTAFGLLAYGFRALLGKERGYYGEVAGG